MIRPGRFAAAVALVAVAGVAVWWLISVQLATGPQAARVTTVTIADDAFMPAAVVIPVGGTVTWRWAGQRRHDIAGTGLSALMQTDGVFTHRFDEPGRYAYVCSVHAACAAW